MQIRVRRSSKSRRERRGRNREGDDFQSKIAKGKITCYPSRRSRRGRSPATLAVDFQSKIAKGKIACYPSRRSRREPSISSQRSRRGRSPTTLAVDFQSKIAKGKIACNPSRRRSPATLVVEDREDRREIKKREETEVGKISYHTSNGATRDDRRYSRVVGMNTGVNNK
ncbi:hypothetical protein U1Q18_038544 [Sarracenia purpurea var. burkii]